MWGVSAIGGYELWGTGEAFFRWQSYFREKGKVNKKVWYGLLGVVIALPIVLIAAGLLSSADAVFRKMTTDFMNWIRPGNIFNVVIRVTFCSLLPMH